VKRKRWSAAEKLRIVLAGMEPGTEISDLCRREGVNPTMYYQWKRQLLGAAERIFERKEHKPSAREQRLSTELTRAKDVIAEHSSTKPRSRASCSLAKASSQVPSPRECGSPAASAS
jgi:transposase